jgi:hypothetical protein
VPGVRRSRPHHAPRRDTRAPRSPAAATPATPGAFAAAAVRNGPRGRVTGGAGAQRHARALEELIGERASLRVVPGAAHAAHWSDARAVAAVLAEAARAEAWRCRECAGLGAVGCPNCEAAGWYEASGRRVQCSCCKGRGRVVCRACFKGDPYDVEAIRGRMRQLPD